MKTPHFLNIFWFRFDEKTLSEFFKIPQYIKDGVLGTGIPVALKHELKFENISNQLDLQAYIPNNLHPFIPFCKLYGKLEHDGLSQTQRIRLVELSKFGFQMCTLFRPGKFLIKS